MAIKKNSGSRPTALGIQLAASVYGTSIPSAYGRTRVRIKVIWMANVRRG